MSIVHISRQCLLNNQEPPKINTQLETNINILPLVHLGHDLIKGVNKSTYSTSMQCKYSQLHYEYKHHTLH